MFAEASSLRALVVFFMKNIFGKPFFLGESGANTEECTYYYLIHYEKV